MKRVLVSLGAVLVLGSALFAATAASKTAKTVADDPNNANLTYWYWAESDAPGANNWLKKEVALYEKSHPKVKVSIVIQATDTLTSAFTTAAQTKSGPDIATQWATLPTLTPAWGGATVPISDYVPKSEWKNWISTSENMWQGKLWAMPQYLIGIPFVWNKPLFKKAGLNPSVPPKTWAQFLADAKKLKAAGITPFGMGNQDGYGGAWFFSLIGKQNLNSITELKQAMIGGQDFANPKFSGFYQALVDLEKNGYLNSDVASISFGQGFELFGQKKAAMSWGTDGNVAQWESQLGAKEHGRRGDPALGPRQARDELRRDAVVGCVHHEVVEAPESGGPVPHVPAQAAGVEGLVQGDRGVPRRQAVPGVVGDGSDRKAAPEARPVAGLRVARELRPAAGRPERRPRGRGADHVRLRVTIQGRQALEDPAVAVEESAS